MSAYRDQRERCPRCGVELIDARAARGCPNCRGLWVEMPSLLEMATQMNAAPWAVQLPFVRSSHQPLPCPTCTELMKTWSLFDIEIDRCEKHGVWFDPDELAQILLAIWVRSSAGT